MSRIGKQPVIIPGNVNVEIQDRQIFAKGPKGGLELSVPIEFEVKQKDGRILIAPRIRKEDKRIKSLWGLNRTLIFNMIKGVTEGYQKKLKIEGIGYKAEVKGKDLILNLGFSHPVEIKAPSGIEFKVEKNIITVEGTDKQLVGETAAVIRSKRKPEPYKGKGISYIDEKIKRKAGKKAAGTE